MEYEKQHLAITYTLNYSRTPVTQTLKQNKKRWELAGNSSYRGKFQWNCDQEKGKFKANEEFELSEFELSRFYFIAS